MKAHSGKKMLVVASTFPRWKDDSLPPFVYELAKRLAEKYEIHVLTPHYPGSKRREVMEGLEVHRFKYFPEKYQILAGSGGILPALKKNRLLYLAVPFFFVFEYRALVRLAEQIKPDIIHAHWTVPQGLVCAALKKIKGHPYMVTAHGGDIYGLRGRFWKKFKKLALRNARKATVVSNALRQEIIENIDENLTTDVISMGVDTEFFNPGKRNESIRNRYGIKGPFLLFVGRLAEKKGIRYLIDAMPAVISIIPEVKLLIVGSGTLEQELKALVDHHDLDENVVFAGSLPNQKLPELYASADIFIAPSIEAEGGDKEGLPVTLMEAMSSGCVVIATDLEGNRDLIDQGKNGLLVRQKSSEDIAAAIIETLKDESSFSKIGNPARKRAIRHYDWNVIAQKYDEIIKGMLEPPPTH